MASTTYLANPTQPPDIIATRRQGTVKYGFGINFQQEVSSDVWAFGRWGWTEGKYESFCYTEAESVLQVGVYAKGTRWHRSLDRAGAVFRFQRNRRLPSDLSGGWRTGISPG